MKKTLAVSLILNGSLLAFSTYLVVAKPVPPPSVAVASLPVLQPVVDNPFPVPPPVARPAPFHWSQLESEDYSTYIARLHAIGCPDQTIRQIVTGELENEYADKKRLLREQGGGTIMPSQLRKLEGEQQAQLANILHSSPEISGTAPADQSAKPQPAIAANRIKYPLALQNLVSDTPAARSSSLPAGKGSAASSLPPPTPSQHAALVGISNSFVKELGGSNQNPNDPKYPARWQKAQRNADDRMRAVMGAQYYTAYQLDLAKIEYQAKNTGK